MKKLSIILLSLGFLVSCEKDSNELHNTALTQQSGTTARSSKVFRGNFYSVQDANTANAPTACSGDVPGFANPGYFLVGSATHTGEIISAQSRGQDITCNLSFATMLLTTTVSGQLSASNGDLIYYYGVDAIDASNYLTGVGTAGTITGTWTVTGGTGRFAGATGSFSINGPVDFGTGTFSIEAVGTINY
jgi:hypothetical protein